MNHNKLTQERFKAVFNNSSLCMQIIARDGRTLMVNPAWIKLWDVTTEFVESFILKDYNIFLDPLVKAMGIYPLLLRALEGEHIYCPLITYDPSVLGKQGRRRITNSIIQPLRNEDGSVEELLIIHHDVTDEQENLERKNFLAKVAVILLKTLDFSQTLESIALATLPYFADGCLIDVIENQRLKRLVGKHIDPQKEKLLSNLMDLFSPDLNSPQPSARVIRSGGPELLKHVGSQIIREHSYNEEHSLLIERIGFKSHMAIPLKHENAIIGAVSFFRSEGRPPFDESDITLAQEICEYAAFAIENAGLYKKAKLAIEERENFISMASHELKTPITAIMLQMEVIKSIIDTPNKLDTEMLKRMAHNASKKLENIDRLIDEMLDIKRLNQGKFSIKKELVDFTQLLDEVVQKFAMQMHRHNIQLDLQITPETYVYCDPFRLDQVISNLITNAINYGEARPISIGLKKISNMARFEITDHGRGIPINEQARIFECFERGSNTDGIKGLGFGLYIGQQIMQEHKSEIKLSSVKGGATTFFFDLPLETKASI